MFKAKVNARGGLPNIKIGFCSRQNDFENNNTTIVLLVICLEQLPQNFIIDSKLCFSLVFFFYFFFMRYYTLKLTASGTRSRDIIFPRLFYHSVLCSFAYGGKQVLEYPTGESLKLIITNGGRVTTCCVLVSVTQATSFTVSAIRKS